MKTSHYHCTPDSCSGLVQTFFSTKAFSRLPDPIISPSLINAEISLLRFACIRARILEMLVGLKAVRVSAYRSVNNCLPGWYSPSLTVVISNPHMSHVHQLLCRASCLASLTAWSALYYSQIDMKLNGTLLLHRRSMACVVLKTVAMAGICFECKRSIANIIHWMGRRLSCFQFVETMKLSNTIPTAYKLKVSHRNRRESWINFNFPHRMKKEQRSLFAYRLSRIWNLPIASAFIQLVGTFSISDNLNYQILHSDSFHQSSKQDASSRSDNFIRKRLYFFPHQAVRWISILLCR